MSLNEIYDNPADNSSKSWQNYRINNLDISQNFNINTTGANVGDVLQLNASLEYTWAPYSETVFQPLEYCIGVFSTTSVPVGGSIIAFDSITGSTIFSINAQGEIVVSESCSLLLFLNMTTESKQVSLPLFTLSKYTSTTNIDLCKTCPYLSLTTNYYVASNCIAPVQCQAGDRIVVYGTLVGNSSQPTMIINPQCSLNILRIN